MPHALRLVPKTVEDALAMVEAMPPADRAQVSDAWLARIQSGADADHWTLGYTLARIEDGTEVGQCGFKGPPVAGVVEIAYGIGPEYQSRGYATEAARTLLGIALESDEVHVVVAHTLDPANASSRVLSRTGFTCTGQVVDPEDGAVWRWERVR